MHIHRFESDLLHWLNKKGRNPLIIRGARQVGKSSLVLDLTSRSHRICFELNFEHHPEHADFFESKDPDIILSHLSMHFKHRIDPQ